MNSRHCLLLTFALLLAVSASPTHLSGRENDWQSQGIASSSLVEGSKLYYTRYRGVVCCLDINGFRHNKNDGPASDENLTGPAGANVIRSFDMMEEFGSYPHNLSIS